MEIIEIICHNSHGYYRCHHARGYCGRLLCFHWFSTTSLSKVGSDLLKNRSAELFETYTRSHACVWVAAEVCWGGSARVQAVVAMVIG
jgi:hypothetical protein